MIRKARGLAKASRWRNLGAHQGRIWGECRSMGASYFKVALDLKSDKSYCSCPSPEASLVYQKALSFLLHDQSELFSQAGETPDWVALRLEEGKKMTSEAERSKLRERNRDQRIEQMAQGAEDLKEWLTELMRTGLAIAFEQGPEFWSAMSSRLVDAKLGSIGKRIEQWPSLFELDNWPERLLLEIGELYRMTRVWEQYDLLKEEEKWDLLLSSGLNLRKEEVRKMDCRPGQWRVWHIRYREEDRLQSRRVWFQEETSGQFALLLDYLWDKRGEFEGDWNPGDLVPANLSFYPSAFPLRAVFHSQLPGKVFREVVPQHAMRSAQQLASHFAKALSRQTWLRQLPVILEAGILFQEKGNWNWQGTEGGLISLTGTDEILWQWYAMRSRGPVFVFGEYDGWTFRPLSALSGGRLVVFGIETEKDSNR